MCNRLEPVAVPDRAGRGTAGGLVVALREAFQGYPGLWFGWSGKVAAKPATRPRNRRKRGEARFNPMSYHNGSVWPHDNALIALGFSRYGFIRRRKAAQRDGLLNEGVFELLHASQAEFLAVTDDAKHLLTVDLTLSLTRGFRFGGLARRQAVEEHRDRLERRIGGRWISREHSCNDQYELHSDVPSLARPVSSSSATHTQ